MCYEQRTRDHGRGTEVISEILDSYFRQHSRPRPKGVA